MANLLNYIRQKLALFGNNLTLAQKITMLLVLALAVGFFITLVRWAIQPEYTILFTGLEAADVQEIVDELSSAGTPYKLTDGGRSILVPKKEVYELRMQFAASDIPTTGGIGYEIFDKNDIGVSEFVQQVNFRRALEGELSRTIQSMQEVVGARVHIVFPKERLFKEDQKQPTASIFLSLRGNSRLRETQIQGISRLVASSVEGLLPENVTIVDSHGNVISKVLDMSSTMAGLNDSQLDLQRRVESHIEGKVQTMLDEVLGVGNSIVRGRVELDFKRIETTNETYDPDNTVVLSEEVEEESISDSSGSPSNSLERTVTNYQLTKSIEHIINNVGDIERLTVSVIVNGTYQVETDEEGVETREYIPRTQDELDRLATMVSNAVGIDETRGDRLEIENIQFDTSLTDRELEYFEDVTTQDEWFKIAERVATGLAILFLFFFLRSQLKKAKTSFLKLNQIGGLQHKALPGGGNYEGIIPPIESEISSKVMRKSAKEQQILNFVTERPEMAAKLIRFWLMEG